LRNELRVGHDLEGDRLDRPPYVWLAVAVELCTAVLALAVGWSPITDPTGAAVGMPLEWIEGSVFDRCLVPGSCSGFLGTGFILGFVAHLRLRRTEQLRLR
jgi:hypothetical protein